MEKSNGVHYSTNQNSLDNFKDALEALWYDRLPSNQRKIHMYTSYSNGKRIMKGRVIRRIHSALNRRKILTNKVELEFLSKLQRESEIAMAYGNSKVLARQAEIDQ